MWMADTCFGVNKRARPPQSWPNFPRQDFLAKDLLTLPDSISPFPRSTSHLLSPSSTNINWPAAGKNEDLDPDFGQKANDRFEKCKKCPIHPFPQLNIKPFLPFTRYLLNNRVVSLDWSNPLFLSCLRFLLVLISFLDTTFKESWSDKELCQQSNVSSDYLGNVTTCCWKLISHLSSKKSNVQLFSW